MRNNYRVCDENACNGCMACMDICPTNAISIKDDLVTYNAQINEQLCIGCNACHNVCPNNSQIQGMAPIEWYQGWAVNEKVRKDSSSGGFAAEFARSFLKGGGVVFSCTFRDGEFRFESAENLDELKKYTGSKYVKSNPIGIYKEIKKVLIEGRKILFIGLPCQVDAVKRFVGKKLEERLFTIDLICHGTPSPEMLQIFLKQYHLNLRDLEDISFRKKEDFGLESNYTSIARQGICDGYTYAFLSSLIYTENCYTCNYARRERVSDLTIGDSWGSELSVKEIKKGVSLVLCQTEKGKELLKNSELHLEAVDLEKAIENNKQLHNPSRKPREREKFFNYIKKDMSFNKSLFYCYPKMCTKVKVKEILFKIGIGKHLFGGGSEIVYQLSYKKEDKK